MRARVKRWLRRCALAGAALVLTAAIALQIAVTGWDYDRDQLSPDRAGPLVITDRRGEVIRRVANPEGRPGAETWVSLDDIPPLVVSTFLVAEDAAFFEHRGVSWRGLARAAYLNAVERRLGYGGSTLTMQLARMVHSPGDRRTLGRKLTEAVLAMRMERALSKTEILEQYLNRAYFANGAYGIEAAARLYYGKPAAALSPGEATLLAVIARSPAAYDPIAHYGATLRRRDHVFGLLAGAGIMSDVEIDLARRQTPRPALNAEPWTARHFTEHVIGELPPEVVARGGVVKTTLDLGLQRRLERAVTEHVAEHADRNLDQAGAVILDTASGEILAMVGSAGWDTANGQINITTRRRHPGSALKPFIYALAIEGGDNPATVAFDAAGVPSDYEVLELTQKERGPVRYREALAGSYNLAAVHTLERVGLTSLMNVLRRSGVGAVEGDPDTYGLRLALGSAKVRLLDLAAGYGFLARGGEVTRPRAIVEVTGHRHHWAPPRAPDVRIFSPETAYLVSDILADPLARRPAFGEELPIDLPFPVAVKTGTSRGFADTVTVAVTEQVTVGAWAGNFDGVPTHGLIAMEASAPIVRAGLLAARAGLGELTVAPRPETIDSGHVCALSGLHPGPDCPHHKLEHFAPGGGPRETCDWHRPDGTVAYPTPLSDWAERQTTQGGRQLTLR
jgi:penicillin-binding protein 1C